MTDEFTAPISQVAGRRATAARIGLLGVAAAAAVAAAILIFGGSASPTGTLAANTAPLPGAVNLQDRGPGGFEGGMMGSHGGGITVTAISGSNISLKTADGWTRTIAVTSTTALTKGSATITLAGLKVGDEVRFAQTHQTDGSYSITKLAVVLPRTGGTVTDIAGSTITVTRRDGTVGTIKVTSSTTYKVGATTGKALTDVKVGMVVDAVGALNADGSLTAGAVRAFDPATMPGRGHDGHGPQGDGKPDASPAASAGTSAG